MSTLNHLFDLPEQLCYVQCGFCTTILMVSVPCSSLSMVVTVRCGHCTSLLSVNMMKASFVPFHLLASLTHLEDQFWYSEATRISFSPEMILALESIGIVEGFPKMNLMVVTLNRFVIISPLQPKESSPEEDANMTLSSHCGGASMMTYSDCDEDDLIPVSNFVNKPPEKRQRTPSAYNRFIKEEIKRLKAENPDMAHKEAFSTAAKNWANFPPTQFKGDEETDSQREQLADLDSHVDPLDDEVIEEGQGFRGRKVPRNSILGRTPFE